MKVQGAELLLDGLFHDTIGSGDHRVQVLLGQKGARLGKRGCRPIYMTRYSLEHWQ